MKPAGLHVCRVFPWPYIIPTPYIDASQMTHIGSSFFGHSIGTWQTCRLAGFISRNFMDAQCHYQVYEQETLATLEALLKWEDKLLGYQVLYTPPPIPTRIQESRGIPWNLVDFLYMVFSL